jgi:hypothetical protein
VIWVGIIAGMVVVVVVVVVVVSPGFARVHGG